MECNERGKGDRLKAREIGGLNEREGEKCRGKNDSGVQEKEKRDRMVLIWTGKR